MQINTFTKMGSWKESSNFGIASAIRYYKDKFPHLHLTEPTVRRNKNAYLEELKKRPRKDDNDLAGGELSLKKRGRPLLLGKNWISKFRIM